MNKAVNKIDTVEDMFQFSADIDNFDETLNQNSVQRNMYSHYKGSEK